MDLPTSSNPSPSNAKPQSDVEKAAIIPSKPARFMDTYRRQQPWSLPDSIIYHIIKNPSTPKVYQKLIQCCKKPFIKNPIIVVNDIKNISDDEWEVNYDWEIERIHFNNLTKKLWIAGNITVETSQSRILLSSILPTIYQTNASCLNISNQNMSFNEFLFLSSTAQKISLYNVSITDEHGAVVLLEKLIDDRFEYYFMNHIPETFNLDDFCVCLKKSKRIQFNLMFDDSISVAYKTRLDDIIDEILAEKNRHYKAPLICYSGIDHENAIKLLDIFYKQSP